jgi:hypothetical protein
MAIAIDKGALKILSGTYWTSEGWKKQPEISAEDFSYAKTAGLMFDPIRLTHDQAVN